VSLPRIFFSIAKKKKKKKESKMSAQPLYSIKSVLLLDGDGQRIFAKYYKRSGAVEFASVADEKAYEKKLFQKTRRSSSEILIFGSSLVVYKPLSDMIMYVTGSVDENELMLHETLGTLCHALGLLLRNQLDKRTVLENLDYVLLALDELIDGGIILENDAELIAGRVSLRSVEPEVPLAEQTLTEALRTARDQLARSLLQ
jgi:coatomer subunit zeta